MDCDDWKTYKKKTTFNKRFGSSAKMQLYCQMGRDLLWVIIVVDRLPNIYKYPTHVENMYNYRKKRSYFIGNIKT